MTRLATLTIRTPEGVVFSQLLAGPVSRFLAWAIDATILTGVLTGVSILLNVLSLLPVELGRAVMLLVVSVLSFVLWVGYGIYFEWRHRGQTLGKKFLRLRVVDAQGLRLHFSQVVIRNLLRFVDMLPGLYLVGGVACVLGRHAQRLGDLAANTVVIRIPRISEPNLDQLAVGKYNSFRSHPHLEARLRQRVSAGEATLALQAIVRRDLLEPSARVELFGALAGHFRQQVLFPAEATDGLTDEQYVRNVLDVLYRPERSRTGRRTGTAAVPPVTP